MVSACIVCCDSLLSNYSNKPLLKMIYEDTVYQRNAGLLWISDKPACSIFMYNLHVHAVTMGIEFNDPI